MRSSSEQAEIDWAEREPWAAAEGCATEARMRAIIDAYWRRPDDPEAWPPTKELWVSAVAWFLTWVVQDA